MSPNRASGSGLARYAVRRTVALAVTAAVALTVLFGLLQAGPGRETSGLAPSVAADDQARTAVLGRAGLDRPLVEQYRSYVAGLARGDLGTSRYDGSSVSAAIARALPVSLQLGVLAAVVAVGPGVVVGVVAARRHGRPVDGASRLVTLLAISVPSYWLAVLALVLVGERAPDLVPGAGGFTTFAEDPAANLRALLLPALVLGLGGFALVARSVRASLVSVLDGDDVRFARAMGMSEGRILRRIGLRREAPAALTVVGLLVAGLLSGTVLVENVFQVPGLGSLMVTAFTRDDQPLALGTALATAGIFLGLNLVVDLAVAAVDPRARVGGPS